EIRYQENNGFLQPQLSHDNIPLHVLQVQNSDFGYYYGAVFIYSTLNKVSGIKWLNHSDNICFSFLF
ncbi:hypothetical protein, partial [Natronobacillus azotifigens]